VHGTPSVAALIAAVVLFIGSLAIGLAMRDRGNETTVAIETIEAAGEDVPVEQITVTETRTPMWWPLIPVGGAVAAAGLLVLDVSRRSDRMGNVEP
jgi:hypothetical protein